jgi:DNA-binding CsgD family transcriptional regulator
MACRFTTLLETLNSLEFRAVILLTLGLDTPQIADLLDTSEAAVLTCLADCLRKTGCRDVEELCVRALHECNNDLYDDTRLNQEMAPLQKAAQKMLARSLEESGLAVLN